MPLPKFTTASNIDKALLEYMNALDPGQVATVIQTANELIDDDEFQRTATTNPQNVLRHALQAAIAELTYEMTADERGADAFTD